ncbi:MAG: SDR family oxidoreductase [Paracoccaceae bacterium]|nr:SDR family oxidoreductase [Paracoccaceae bacterium]
MTKIAITGATGQLGRLAISAILRRDPGADLVALVRDLDRAGDLGVPLRQADYHQPETLRAALAGVDVLVLISSSDFNDRAGQHRNVIDAAKAAGVGRIVYTSILKGAASPLMLAPDHVATEAALAEAGIPATILRNGWYTENYTGSLGAALQADMMIGAAGNAVLSTAPRADYAEALAVAALDAGTAGQTYELGGAGHTLAELAAEVSRQTGRDIPYVDMDEATYRDTLLSFGLPAPMAAAIADADAKARDMGALTDDSGALARLIGRPTTPLSVSVAAALAAL